MVVRAADSTARDSTLHSSENPVTSPALPRIFEAGRAFGKNRLEIQRNLGKPLAVAVREVANRHGPGTDSLFTFRFPRTEIVLLRVSHDGKEIVRTVTTWDPDRTFPGNLRMGRSSRQQIDVGLGRPDTVQQKGDTLQLGYYSNGVVNDVVLLHMLQDTVRMIEWRFYVD